VQLARFNFPPPQQDEAQIDFTDLGTVTYYNPSETIDFTKDNSSLRYQISKLSEKHQQDATKLRAQQVLARQERDHPYLLVAIGTFRALLKDIGIQGPWLDHLFAIGVSKAGLKMENFDPTDRNAFGRTYNEALAYRNALDDRFAAIKAFASPYVLLVIIAVTLYGLRRWIAWIFSAR
jgi:hypothetical protein